MWIIIKPSANCHQYEVVKKSKLLVLPHLLYTVNILVHYTFAALPLNNYFMFIGITINCLAALASVSGSTASISGSTASVSEAAASFLASSPGALILASVSGTRLSALVTTLQRKHNCKKSSFYVPRPSFFVCPGDTLWQSRKTLHE